MQRRPVTVVSWIVVAVVIIGNDVTSFGVQQPQPRINHSAEIQRARHIRIERDMQQRLAIKG